MKTTDTTKVSAWAAAHVTAINAYRVHKDARLAHKGAVVAYIVRSDPGFVGTRAALLAAARHADTTQKVRKATKAAYKAAMVDLEICARAADEAAIEEEQGA